MGLVDTCSITKCNTSLWIGEDFTENTWVVNVNGKKLDNKIDQFQDFVYLEAPVEWFLTENWFWLYCRLNYQLKTFCYSDLHKYITILIHYMNINILVLIYIGYATLSSGVPWKGIA